MLHVLHNGTDITAAVEESSVRITEQGNNRRDTATFTSLMTPVTQGASVQIYERMVLRDSAASGQAVLKVKDTFEYEQKWRIGDAVKVDIGGVPRTYRISAVDHVAKTVTLNANLPGTLGTETVIGRLKYAGVVLKNPDKEFGHNAEFEYNVQVADWGTLFDRKNVVETFEDQYPREIIGRIIYEFCANDSETTLDNFESAWTEGGTAIAMSADTADRLQGTNSQSTGVTGAGTATWTKTITSTDLSVYTHLRFWWKVAEGSGVDISAMSVQVGTDGSNYFSYDITNIGQLFEDVWNYESVVLLDHASVTGSPDLAAVTWLRISITTTDGIAAPKLHFDHMTATTGGFTLQNTQRGNSKFADVRGNHTKPSAMTEKMAKQQGMFWYIDYERDVNFYAKDGRAAPFDLTDTSQNYGDLEIEPDITNLTNQQTVRGAEAPDELLYTQESVTDGVQASWYLDYKPKDISVYISPWDEGSQTNTGFVQKTIGIENLVSEADVDFVFNFQEKTLRCASHPVPAEKDIIRFTYYPYKAIRVRVKDPTSIGQMKALTGGDGVYEGRVINDQTIRTFNEARLRAQAEIDAYKNPVITASFKTDVDGLHVGQVIHITDSDRGIDDDFLIQRIHADSKKGGRFSYDVTCGSTLFGLIEFMQMLFSRSDNTVIDANEIVDVVLNQDETITWQDSVNFEVKPITFQAGDRQTKWFDFVAEAGSVSASGLITDGWRFSNWYAEFIGAETGVAEFAAANDEDGKELRLEADTGGAGNGVQARIIYRMPIKPATEYQLTAWLQILADLTNINAGGGVTVELNTYADKYGGSALDTETVIDAQTLRQVLSAYQHTFTTHADAEWYDLKVTLNEAAGVVSIGDILLDEQVPDSNPNPAIASFSQTI